MVINGNQFYRIIGKLIGKQQIGFEMAFTIGAQIALQRMVAVLGGDGRVVNQRVEHINQSILPLNRWFSSLYQIGAWFQSFSFLNAFSNASMLA